MSLDLTRAETLCLELQRDTWRRRSIVFPLLTATVVVWFGWVALKVWGESYPNMGYIVNPERWMYDLVPFGALCVASAWCGLRYGTTAFMGKGRRAPLPPRDLVSDEQLAWEWMAADALALIKCLIYVSVLPTVWLFVADDGLLRKLTVFGLTSGAANVREVLSWVLGVPTAAGCVAWACLGLAYRPVRRFVLLVCFGVVGIAYAHSLCRQLPPPKPGHYEVIVPSRTAEVIGDVLSLVLRRETIPWLLAIVPLGYFTGIAALVARKKTLSARGLYGLVALWTIALLLTYPFEPLMAQRNVWEPQSFQLSAAVAGLLVMPYFAALLDIHRLRRVAAADVAACAISSPKAPARFRRRLGLVVAVLFLAWLRWPAEPAVRAYWHAQGLPATLEELDAFYPRVPDSENVALTYLDISGRYRERLSRWVDTLPGVSDTGHKSERPEEDIPDDVMMHLLVKGHAKCESGKALDRETWRWTKVFWEDVAREAVDELRAAAQSGKTLSRYPIDLTMGGETYMRHLYKIRDLARLIAIKATLDAIEGRSEEAANAIPMILPIANSLREEPCFISQLVRLAVLEIVLDSLETVMERTGLSDMEMERLQQILGHALPSLRDGHIMDRAMIGEGVMWEDMLRDPTRVHDAWIDGDWPPHNPLGRITALVWNAIGNSRLERLALCWTLDDLSKWSRRASELRQIDLSALEKAGWPFESPFPYYLCDGQHLRHQFELGWHVAIASEVSWPLRRPYYSEWQHRTRIDLARTALGVERFRLAHGVLPESLDEIVPRYLDRVPEDVGHPGHGLSYRIKDDGGFVLYSFARNGRDDHGEEVEQGRGWYIGDMGFTVVPPEAREAALASFYAITVASRNVEFETLLPCGDR